jgi:hypothetical protein
MVEMKTSHRVGLGKTWCIRTNTIAQTVKFTGIIPLFPMVRKVYVSLANREKQHSGFFKMFIAPLEIDSKFVHGATANSCM